MKDDHEKATNIVVAIIKLEQNLENTLITSSSF